MPAPENATITGPIRLARLSRVASTTVLLQPDADARAAMSADLGLLGLRKVRLEGVLHPQGKRDWKFDGTLGATVVQACVITGTPVTTRIDEPVLRTYVAALPDPTGDEMEMPEDDSVEPLPELFDPTFVLREALSLALPAYPKAEGATLDAAVFAGPGITPMTDEAAKPLAGLGALRNRLSGQDNEPGSDDGEHGE